MLRQGDLDPNFISLVKSKSGHARQDLDRTMVSLSIDMQPATYGDRYLLFLSCVLGSYMMLGKGFAYVGIFPLFIGEIALIAGLIVLYRSGCALATLTSMPALMLATTMGWVAILTLSDVRVYGFDALRDSVVIMYGFFAFVVIGLVLEDWRRINKIIRYYGILLLIYIPAVPFLFIVSRYLTDYIPRWPAYNVPMLVVLPSDVSVHIAGAAVFVLAGFRRASMIVILFALVAFVMAATANRGGMMATLIPVLLAAILLGQLRKIAVIACIACCGPGRILRDRVDDRSDQHAGAQFTTAYRQCPKRCRLFRREA